MLVSNPGFSPSRSDLAPARGGRRRPAPVALLSLAAILLLPLIITGRALAEDDADGPLPLPQLAAPSVPAPQPTRPAPLKTSRRMPLSEPLPPVERPSAPIPLQATAPGANSSAQPIAGLAAYNQPSTAPDQIPMPLIRPQQVTVPGGLRPLSDITVDIAPTKGPLPKDRSDVLVVGTTNPMFYARSAIWSDINGRRRSSPIGPFIFRTCRSSVLARAAALTCNRRSRPRSSWATC